MPVNVGGGFPVVTPHGEVEWWVIPEGFAGQLVQGFSPQGPALHIYTVKQATTKPAGAVAGPFSTQAEAQQQADTLNVGGTATPGNIASAAAASAAGSPLAPLFQSQIWLRVLEVVAGLVILAIGLNALFKGRPLQVVTGAAGLAARAVP